MSEIVPINPKLEIVPIDPKLESDLCDVDSIYPQFSPGPWTVEFPDFEEQEVLYHDDRESHVPYAKIDSASGRNAWSELAHVFVITSGTEDRRGRANAKLISACTDMFDAMVAGIRYDNAIKNRVVDGAVQIMETGGAVAMGDDLDALYMDWINKTRLALQKVLVGKKDG